MRIILLFLCAVIIAGPAAAGSAPLHYVDQRLELSSGSVTARIPQGYRLEMLTTALKEPRMLTFGTNGDLFIGSKSGTVYRIPPPYAVPGALVNLGGYPHSIAFRRGEILIARTDGVYRAPYGAGQEKILPSSVTLLAALPAGGGHNSRTVTVGPDGRVYASLGIQGNCSDQYLGAPYAFDDRRGGVLVLHEDAGGRRWEPYASGLRNPVGLAWQPQTETLYASNNGPDHWGFDLPPEYFSKLTPGSFHGMPWFQYDGKQLRRDDCISSAPPQPASQVSLPVATFPARSAPMGVAFVPNGALDARLKGDAIVALHGSWGTKPSGGAFGDPASRREPKLVAVRFEHDKAVRVDNLITGFQNAAGDRWARPVGVAIGPDGALYFTSDSGVEGLFRLRRLP